MSYNGWSNRETWLVSVWYSPETKQDLEAIKDMLEDQYDDLPNGPLKDMIDFSSINWRELEESLDDEEDDED